jgi:DNA-directed RNA polymerase specialized sigma24 family protein
MGDEELYQLIRGCVNQDRKSQKLLYKAFYGFAMAICLRYAGDRDEAAEVMNQGFLKVFNNIHKYDEERRFKAWLGKIMTNVSIDYYRANLKMAYSEDLEKAEHIADGDLVDRNLNYADLLAMVQRLPQAEIAEMLHINIGTSKSNLFKARQKLKQMILTADQSANNYNRGMDQNSIVAINGTDFKPAFFSNGIR